MNLNYWINPIYLNENKISKLKTDFLSADFFPHISIDNLFLEEKLLKINEALKSEEYYLEESDLYEFMRTEDFKKTKNKVLLEFRNFLMSDEFISFIESLTDIKIKRNYIDIHSLKLKNTHYLLCHDDKVQNRKIAFIINFTNMEENDGAILEFIKIDKNNNGIIFKKIIPKFGKFNMFQVTDNSFHQISENVSKKERITIGGWYS